MSDAPQLPAPPDGDGGHPVINIGGQGNVINFGGNVTSQTASVAAVQSFLKRMASHGIGYWLFHFVLAVLAAAAFEFTAWYFHWFSR